MFTVKRPPSNPNPGTVVETYVTTPAFEESLDSTQNANPSASMPTLGEAFQVTPNDKKRPAPPATTSRTLKRTKSGSTTNGQSSLKGFFKPKTAAEVPVDKEVSPEKTAGGSPTKNERAMARASTPPNYAEHAVSAASEASPFASQMSQSIPASPSQFVDPIVSKESWGKLFSKPVLPRCEGHNEPCKTMKTRKPGFNCGRDFWMCARYVQVCCCSVFRRFCEVSFIRGITLRSKANMFLP